MTLRPENDEEYQEWLDEALGQMDGRRLELMVRIGAKCAWCPEYNPFFLEFDHKDPAEKKFNLSGSGLSKPLEDILAELDKCQLLCLKCHKLKTQVNGDMRRTKTTTTRRRPQMLPNERSLFLRY